MLLAPPDDPHPRPPLEWLGGGLLLSVIGGAGALAITHPSGRALAGMLALAGVQYLLAVAAVLPRDERSAASRVVPLAMRALVVGEIVLWGRAVVVGLVQPLILLRGFPGLEVAVGIGMLAMAVSLIAEVRLVRSWREALHAAHAEGLVRVLGRILREEMPSQERDYLADLAHQRALTLEDVSIAETVVEICRERVSPSALWWMRLRQAWRDLALGQAEVVAERAMLLHDRAGHDLERLRQARTLQAAAALYAGRPGEALAAASAGGEPLALAGEEWFELSGVLRLAALLDGGVWDEAADWGAVLAASFRGSSPLRPHLHRLLARLRLEVKTPAAALALFAADSRDPIRGRALLAAGRAEEAAALLDAAEREAVTPFDLAEALRERARLRLATGDAADAERDAGEAVALAPGDPEARLLLAEALAALGRAGAAHTTLAEAAALDASHGATRRARELLAAPRAGGP